MEAGEILLRHHESLKPGDVDRKGRIDMVTVADRVSETHIKDRIRAAFPDHVIVAEESSPGDVGAAVDVPRWYVDPLDGTTNFVNGLPVFGVSIACWQGDVPQAAVVHAPYLGETWRAARGQGAFLGDRRLHVTGVDQLEDAVIATGFHYDRKTQKANNVGNFNNLILEVRGLRVNGSAALDLAYVAAGRLDGFWEAYLGTWDVAAGILLVKEAGGRVTDFTGGNDSLCGGSIVAAGPVLHGRILERLVEGPGIS